MPTARASASARRGRELRAVADQLHRRRCRSAKPAPPRAARVSAQEDLAVRAGEARVGGAEDAADVAESGGGEQRVARWRARRRRRRCGPARPGSPGQCRPASQSSARSSSKACTSMPMPMREHARSRRRAAARRGARSHGGRDLEGASASPGTTRTGCPAAATSAASSVYSCVAARVGGVERVAREALRRLHGARARERSTVSSTRAVGADALDRVADGRPGITPCPGATHAAHDARRTARTA